MGPAVRDKVRRKPANETMRKPAIWQDQMGEVKETFRRIARVKHSGFTVWSEDEQPRRGPVLSRNRMARVARQVPLKKSFNLPLSTLREIQNNRSQPPFVSFTHLQNVIGMCRRINAQSSLTERRKNPHDPWLYPVFVRRPVFQTCCCCGGDAPKRRPETPNSSATRGGESERRPETPSSAQKRRPWTPTAGEGGEVRPETPNSAQNRRPITPGTPPAAGRRPVTPPSTRLHHRFCPCAAAQNTPFAYLPPRFSLLLNISNRPAALGPPPSFAPRPATPRPASSRRPSSSSLMKPKEPQLPPPSQPLAQSDSSSRPPPSATSTSKKLAPPRVPALNKLWMASATGDAADSNSSRTTGLQASDRTHDRLWTFPPFAASYFDHRPVSAGDVHQPMERRPPSRCTRRQSAGGCNNLGEPGRAQAGNGDSSNRSTLSTDGVSALSVPDSLSSSCMLPDRMSPTGSVTDAEVETVSSRSSESPRARSGMSCRRDNFRSGDCATPRSELSSPRRQPPPSRNQTMPASRKPAVPTKKDGANQTTEHSTQESSNEKSNLQVKSMPRLLKSPSARPELQRPMSARTPHKQADQRVRPLSPHSGGTADSTIIDKTSRELGSKVGAWRPLPTDRDRELLEELQIQAALSSEEASPGRSHKVTFATSSLRDQRQKIGKQRGPVATEYLQSAKANTHKSSSDPGTPRHAEEEEDDDDDDDEEKLILNHRCSPTKASSDLNRASPGDQCISDNPKPEQNGSETSLPSPRFKQTENVLVASEDEEDVDIKESTDQDSNPKTPDIQSGSESSGLSASEHDREEDEQIEEEEGEEDEEGEEAEGEVEAKEIQPNFEGDGQSHVYIKYSADAYVDFKNSMMRLITNEHLQSGHEDQLEELFEYYIDLNPPVHHKVLRKVISDIKTELKRSNN